VRAIDELISPCFDVIVLIASLWGKNCLSEQIRSTSSDTTQKHVPRVRASATAILLEMVGGLLTAGAILFCVNGGMTEFAKISSLSIVAASEITDAKRTLDPAVSEQLVEQAKKCTAPLAYVTVSKTTYHSSGTFRIHSGSYVSPPYKLTDEPQRIAIPFPAPFPTGSGQISIEGEATGTLISLSPGWRIESLHNSATQPVIWDSSKPCR
jgi:hypothetical protein